MTDILNIEDEPIFDDRIVKIETHAYNPFANTTFGYSDEIRIPIQQQNLYTLPYESFVYIEGKLTKNRIRYELDGVEIDRNRNVGVTSTLKHYVTTSSDRSVILRNAGWDAHTSADGYFNFCVPLYALLGFCEDYRHVIINARHELILIRSRNDNNCLMGNSALAPMVDLFKIQWRMPHRTTKHSWAIKTATQLEKPRYVIFALQAGRKDVMAEDTSRFDDCNLTNIKLYLNSECYPYDDMNLDFDKNRWSVLYETYARFCKGYYGYEYLEPSISPSHLFYITIHS
ncbi:hypothetical protein P5V15_005721 [Pogonomyrmex californicus]